jgi:hypothetical protein
LTEEEDEAFEEDEEGGPVLFKETVHACQSSCARAGQCVNCCGALRPLTLALPVFPIEPCSDDAM